MGLAQRNDWQDGDEELDELPALVDSDELDLDGSESDPDDETEDGGELDLSDVGASYQQAIEQSGRHLVDSDQLNPKAPRSGNIQTSSSNTTTNKSSGSPASEEPSLQEIGAVPKGGGNQFINPDVADDPSERKSSGDINKLTTEENPGLYNPNKPTGQNNSASSSSQQVNSRGIATNPNNQNTGDIKGGSGNKYLDILNRMTNRTSKNKGSKDGNSEGENNEGSNESSGNNSKKDGLNKKINESANDIKLAGDIAAGNYVGAAKRLLKDKEQARRMAMMAIQSAIPAPLRMFFNKKTWRALLVGTLILLMLAFGIYSMVSSNSEEGYAIDPNQTTSNGMPCAGMVSTLPVEGADYSLYLPFSNDNGLATAANEVHVNDDINSGSFLNVKAGEKLSGFKQVTNGILDGSIQKDWIYYYVNARWPMLDVGWNYDSAPGGKPIDIDTSKKLPPDASSYMLKKVILVNQEKTKAYVGIIMESGPRPSASNLGSAWAPKWQGPRAFDPQGWEGASIGISHDYKERTSISSKPDLAELLGLSKEFHNKDKVYVGFASDQSLVPGTEFTCTPPANSGQAVGNPNGKTVCLDPGHPSENEGTTYKGSGGPFTEIVFNQEIANKTKTILETAGYKVIMTKTSANQEVSNKQRAIICNEGGAALSVRIHGDSVGASKSGFSIYYPSCKDASKMANIDIVEPSSTAATKFKDAYISGTQFAYKNKAGVLKPESDTNAVQTKHSCSLEFTAYAKSPTVLIEAVNMDNAADMQNYLANSHQGAQQIAEGIAKGTIAALGN